MPSKSLSRQQKRIDAAAFLEKHHDPIAVMLIGVIGDLTEEVEGMRNFEADAAYAAELAYRLSRLMPGDALAREIARVVVFFVALLAVGVYRHASQRLFRREKRLDRLERRMIDKGPKMIAAHRKHLERRIAKLSAA
jgi:hypothetical protein